MKRWGKSPPAPQVTAAARQTPPGARPRSRRPRAARPSLRVGRVSPPATAGQDGWSPPPHRQRSAATEPGVQVGSSALAPRPCRAPGGSSARRGSASLFAWGCPSPDRSGDGHPHANNDAEPRRAEEPPGARHGLGARADEPTCTPGSVAADRCRCGGGDHPSWPAVAGGLTRPTRRLGRAALGRLLRGLAPGGVCLAAAVTCGAGGLLPHRFTLTGRPPGRRSAFCGTVPRVAPGGC